MDLRLSGTTAFVTGGSAGIGLAICRRLVAEGVAVGFCGRDRTRLDEAQAELTVAASARGYVADVLDEAALESAITAATDELGAGKLDLLVVNAGGAAGANLLDSTPEQWQRTFALNVGHAANAVRSAAPRMTGDRSAIVLVASISGRKPAPRTAYSVAKAAEIHLAAVLANELAPRGIRVNSVSPGSVLFPGGGWERFKAAHPAEFDEFVRSEMPTGRMVTADEVADVVTFALSPRAMGLNGADIAVDGAQHRASAYRFPNP